MSSDNLYTPASSLVSVPTITFSSRGMFSSWSTSVNPNGLNFAAQPPVFANDVRLQLLGSAIVASSSFHEHLYEINESSPDLRAAVRQKLCSFLSTTAP